MTQLTLASVGFERCAKTTRRAVFLAEMERVVPWPALCRMVEGSSFCGGCSLRRRWRNTSSPKTCRGRACRPDELLDYAR